VESATTVPLVAIADLSAVTLAVSPVHVPMAPRLPAASPGGPKAPTTMALVVTPDMHDRFPPRPTPQEVLRELEYFEHAHPGWAAVALNTHATSLSDLYLVQSHLSVPWIGRVAFSHFGKARALIPAGREPAWVRRALHAQRCGHEVEFTDQLVLVDGTQPWLRMRMRYTGNVLLVGAQVI